jgi:hypothetical protein
LPRWREMWPWFGWPALAIALFGIHQALSRRRPSIRPLLLTLRVSVASIPTRSVSDSDSLPTTGASS